MLFNKRFLQLVAGGLLLLFPASLFAAAAQISGTADRGAIDTLTVEDGASFGKVAGNVDMIIFQTDSLASAAATRNKIVFVGSAQLDCRFFRIQSLGVDRFQINVIGGTITSVKLNGTEIPTVGGITSKAGQLFRRDDANQNAPLSACGPVPSASFYGLVALVLALAGFVIWLFRRRMAPKRDLA
ncbi:MAG: hypothetical protein ACRECJ_07950 [Limisphaerales bacterium]